MKKFPLLLLSAFLGLFLLNFPLHTIHAESTLTMGILTNDQPYSVQKNGKWQGFSVKLAQKLATESNKKITFKAYSSTEKLTTALKSGKVDFILGDKANFSTAFKSTESFLYPKNVLFTRTDAKAKSLEKLAGKKVGLLQTGQQTALLKQLGLKPVSFATTAELMDALANKKISAAILNEDTYQAYLKEHPELIKPAADATSDQKAAVLHKISDPSILAQSLSLITYKQPKVQKLLTTSLTELQDSSQLTTLSQKYFGQDLTIK